MKDFENNSLKEIEEKIKIQFESIELEPIEETLAAIKPKLKKKRRQNLFKSHAFTTRFVAAAASILLLFGIGLSAWLIWSQGNDPDYPPEYRYEDLDIELKPYNKNDIIDFSGLYIPNLELLTIDEICSAGIHKESLEIVYFIVEGMNVDVENGIARKITLTIILQKKYEIKREELYTSDKKITVAQQNISIFKDGYQEPFTNYKLGFKRNNVRYYIDYQTSSSNENDIKTFMELFLK